MNGGYASFHCNADGTLEAALAAPLVGAITNLGDQLREVVEHGGGAGSEIHARLFPRAYLDPTEDRAELEWQAASHGDLVNRRIAQIELLEATLRRAPDGDPVRVTLSPEEVEAWLGVINDVRLSLGVALEVTPDTDLDAIALDDPRRSLADVYEVLGFVLELMLRALMDE